MQHVLEIVKNVLANSDQYIGVATQLFTALIAVGMLLPGDFPEKQLQAIVDFIAKFSRKPKP